ncbi:hypothetical protein K7432_003932 [Basidiobolus ranarum]|uniref:Uncharacterized protein n=1 Tax=Basidiobolus ranarum TaxID=34480 RepID=A0ABR2W5E4_9FUNG
MASYDLFSGRTSSVRAFSNQRSIRMSKTPQEIEVELRSGAINQELLGCISNTILDRDTLTEEKTRIITTLCEHLSVNAPTHFVLNQVIVSIIHEIFELAQNTFENIESALSSKSTEEIEIIMNSLLLELGCADLLSLTLSKLQELVESGSQNAQTIFDESGFQSEKEPFSVFNTVVLSYCHFSLDKSKVIIGKISNCNDSVMENLDRWYKTTFDLLKNYLLFLLESFSKHPTLSQKPLIYSRIANACNHLIPICEVAESDFTLLNLSWKHLSKLIGQFKSPIMDEMLKVDAINRCLINGILEQLKGIDALVSSNDIVVPQVKRHVTVIRFYLSHVQTLVRLYGGVLCSCREAIESLLTCFFILRSRIPPSPRNNTLPLHITTLLRENILPSLDNITAIILVGKSMSEEDRVKLISVLIDPANLVNTCADIFKAVTREDIIYSKIQLGQNLLQNFNELSESSQHHLFHDLNQTGNRSICILRSFLELVDCLPLSYYINGEDLNPNDTVAEHSDDFGNEFYQQIVVSLATFVHCLSNQFPIWEVRSLEMLLSSRGITSLIILDVWTYIAQELNEASKFNIINVVMNLIPSVHHMDSITLNLRQFLGRLLCYLQPEQKTTLGNQLASSSFSGNTSTPSLSADILKIWASIPVDKIFNNSQQLQTIFSNISELFLSLTKLVSSDSPYTTEMMLTLSLTIGSITNLIHSGLVRVDPSTSRKLVYASLICLKICGGPNQVRKLETDNEAVKMFSIIEGFIILLTQLQPLEPKLVLETLNLITEWFVTPSIVQSIPKTSICRFIGKCGLVKFPDVGMKELVAEKLASLCRNILASENWLVIQECYTQLVYFATYATHVEMVEQMIPESAQPALINFVGKVPVSLEGCNSFKIPDYSKSPHQQIMTIEKIIELTKHHQSLRIDKTLGGTTTNTNGSNGYDTNLLTQVQGLNLSLAQSQLNNHHLQNDPQLLEEFQKLNRFLIDLLKY